MRFTSIPTAGKPDDNQAPATLPITISHTTPRISGVLRFYGAKRHAETADSSKLLKKRWRNTT